MQLHELAKSVGKDTGVIKEFLGVSSHLIRVSDEDIEKVVEAFGKVKKVDRGNAVRLWSDNKTHHIAVAGGSIIVLEDYQLTVEKNSDVYNEIKRSKDVEIKLVVDKPFADVSDQTAFRMILEERCFTDQGKELLQEGFAFVRALFFPSELLKVAELMQDKNGLRGVIQLAVNTKSYTSL